MIFALEMERCWPEWHGQQPRQAFRRSSIGFAHKGHQTCRGRLASARDPQNRRSIWYPIEGFRVAFFVVELDDEERRDG